MSSKEARLLTKNNQTDLPIRSYRNSLIKDRRARVTKSPKLAAIGVATLSGLIPYLFDITITPTIIPEIVDIGFRMGSQNRFKEVFSS